MLFIQILALKVKKYNKLQMVYKYVQKPSYNSTYES